GKLHRTAKILSRARWRGDMAARGARIYSATRRPPGRSNGRTTMARLNPWRPAIAGPILGFGLATVGQAVGAHSSAGMFKLPDQIDWKGTGGNRSAVLVGDPEKPGLYVVINKWLAGNFSRPHFHPNDRFITVLKGTWWVGTGNKFDPNNTVAMPAGTFVTHFWKQLHWYGAKDEAALLRIVGEGPARITRVEEAN